ncbi:MULTISPECIES: exonuclease SbcCD subunit D C-terminal domain-containing protein [Psychrobacter]|jgi:exonuclease SbcD|uniref:exonuclease SbcCD subunit D C-terminal domain-containing protein n=1 Tax=Psychrobacter TaxID=497 RepID=UPI000869A214|nr:MULTISPECIES: exonuclease SbcCD subunit D C-terminal domain-containing protein [Psychrobacter]MBA6244333.1 exonuclease SbcCD subunit D C-terminal domain-containing protein [Psychrobacter sp. Urea-trap-18]MBA6286340.1 exonuclease SbcCD subunit D C-terminal domain-containing protein [Psychrobacter sp. Urea-trap-16]MBA6317693.1 exonuclease SbcCD subunit D C-terminal domain-containing protein [Psychrobacter sp. Urea-trap-20]MBA6335414.1 exonuclease SbcCD subunit D C-terminal domain-containing pr|tara:strand:+ start:18548 stop:20170 length:1623 start_codon:yes stop_codon:yes gene_type:complete
MPIPDASLSSSLTTQMKPLTILHTSDWHLGRRLYGRLRYEEFELFLHWLQDTISAQQVDILIVAGDIFDTMTPSNKAQALYYEFLGKVSRSCCQHVVIVAGNHDSPTFLDAPSNVLKFLNVHVIGTACDDLEDEVLVLGDDDNNPHCIIAAVPYLRDRDVRSSSAGESADSKDANVIAGICEHYDNIADIAKSKQADLIKMHQRYIPIIATGHLFASGGRTTEDDGVRELYVGSLGKISADMFNDGFDYVALGHLHVPQRVGGRESIRYSGSPIAMGFGEAKQQKQVLLVQFGAAEHFNNDILGLNVAPDDITPHAINIDADIGVSKVKKTVDKLAEKTAKKVSSQELPFMDDLFGFDEPLEDEEVKKSTVVENTPIQPEQYKSIRETSTDAVNSNKILHRDDANQMQVVSLPIPKFQQLAQISGDLTTIEQTIQALTQSDSIWLEIVYTGDEIVSDLREQVQAMVEGLPCEVLKIKNTRTYNKVLNQQQTSENLQDLNEMEVFERCLTINDVADSQKDSLRDAYGQILYNLRHEDKQAE